MAQETLTVQATTDYIARLVRRKSPLGAFAELIWNSLDADATQVEVRFSRTLETVNRIWVTDDGGGISPDDARRYFRQLGDSWKKRHRRTRREGRPVHGARGEGRFRAFALGDHVAWSSRADADEGPCRVRISGRWEDVVHLSLDIERDSRTGPTGTTVEIEEVPLELQGLLAKPDDLRSRLTQIFATYLLRFPDVKVCIEGVPLDPEDAIQKRTSLELEPVRLSDGTLLQVEGELIRWNSSKNRSEVVYCDDQGMPLHAKNGSVAGKSRGVSLVLSGAIFEALSEKNLLEMQGIEELDAIEQAAQAGVEQLLQAERAKRRHDRISAWKAQGVYPYGGSPARPVERVEQEVFNRLALTIADRLPNFDGRSEAEKQLTFRLLRHALEENPEHVVTIMNEVLRLSPEEQEQMASVLQRSNLSSLIKLARTVTARIDFLAALERIIADREARRAVNERDHLHKMVAEESWIFGDDHNLMVSERSLTNALREVVRDQNLEVDLLDGDPAEFSDGRRLDLMFGRARAHNGEQDRSYLVVELKRPSLALSMSHLEQVMGYADFLSKSHRVAPESCWSFWLVGTSINPMLMSHSRQSNRAPGLVHDKDGRQIWVRTWRDLIHEGRCRHEYLRQQLDLDVTDSQALEQLRARHGDHLPKVLHDHLAADN